VFDSRDMSEIRFPNKRQYNKKIERTTLVVINEKHSSFKSVLVRSYGVEKLGQSGKKGERQGVVKRDGGKQW